MLAILPIWSVYFSQPMFGPHMFSGIDGVEPLGAPGEGKDEAKGEEMEAESAWEHALSSILVAIMAFSPFLCVYLAMKAYSFGHSLL